MKPTVGRIVHYRLAAHDVTEIEALRKKASESGEYLGNGVQEGDVHAAIIVRTWGPTETSAVNLQVLLDGPGSYWATSRVNNNGDSGEIAVGSWGWPPRA